MVLAGRQMFNTLDEVIRLRRIHRQKGADAFKESTIRLRDAANTVDDYELWKSNELDSVDPDATCSWIEYEDFLREAVVGACPLCRGVPHKNEVWYGARRASSTIGLGPPDT